MKIDIYYRLIKGFTNRFDFSITNISIDKTDVCTTFEMIHRFMTKEIKEKEKTGELKAELSHLTNSYYHSNTPNASALTLSRPGGQIIPPKTKISITLEQVMVLTPNFMTFPKI